MACSVTENRVRASPASIWVVSPNTRGNRTPTISSSTPLAAQAHSSAIAAVANIASGTGRPGFSRFHELRRAFLDACDRQQQVAEAARLAASYLSAGHQPADFIALLGHALLREDAGFHMVQNLQAAVGQYLAWQGDREAAPILVATARYLAAHAPTLRARHQTARVAQRLMRGGAVHEDANVAEF